MTERSLPPTPQARILVVDDEATARTAVARALDLRGYRTEEAGSGDDALTGLASHAYDLLLLDLMMPDMTGLEVLERVHETHPNVAVIVFTAYGTLDTAIEALRMGATDYLLKPCSLREVEAAVVRALQCRRERARRQELVRVMVDALQALQVEFEEEPPILDAQSGRFVRCGSLTLDQEKRLAIVDAADDAGRSSAELTVNEAILLAHFMQRPDTVLSCRELAQDALGYDVSEKEAQEIIRPHISRLRSKIEPDATPPRWIRTIRGKGYMLSSS
jgi:DNA-binding response OmpR family regulator